MRNFILALLIMMLAVPSLSAQVGYLTDVSPDNAHPGSELWVEITGSDTHFGEGSETTVKMEIPSTNTIYPTQFHVTSHDTIQAYFVIPPDVVTGLYDVVVKEEYIEYPFQYVWRLTEEFSIEYPSDCGDIDRNGEINIDDVKLLILYVYLNESLLEPMEVADLNCDRKINLIDISQLIQYLFRGGPHPCGNCP